jgi:hypothetical protein
MPRINPFFMMSETLKKKMTEKAGIIACILTRDEDGTIAKASY